MPRTTTLFLLLLAACATVGAGGKGGKKPQPQPVPVAPTPKPLIEKAEEVPCPEKPPVAGWQLEVGWGDGKTEAEARNEAKDDAVDELTDRLCSGRSKLACSVVTSHIVQWGTGEWDPKKRTACVSMAIDAKTADTFQADINKFSADLKIVAAEVAKGWSGQKVELRPVMWGSGCVVGGDLGNRVASEMREALGEYRMPMVPPGKSDASAHKIRLELTPSNVDAKILASLVTSDGKTDYPLKAVSFSPDLFNLQGEEVGNCVPDSVLGINDGEKVGRDGLGAHLEIETNNGELCEGDKRNPILTVTAPARVKVYSLNKAGSGFLVWPAPGQSDLVTKELDIGEVQMIALPELGHEKLLAVAVPQKESFGGSDKWAGFCKLRDTFGPLSYPPQAAIASTTFSVIPNGTKGCPTLQTVDKEELLRQLDYAPFCDVSNR